ncbi:unnamed protein product [Aspergillus oryzae]|uniref:Signal recognition particle subunit SRP72 n=2 Tax=Aspergillus oryzae TaxID=5062 RepID=A0AAN4YP49_ASPOZ|nr:unnamed protein product [Aspergillus oryzae]GMF89344.1 unnamed protein product [Aspergillus oryzae]GMG11097.1 unnamed protein product [Aspergillus oryzae]GMG34892.1 unnamed protein product [Aspergillus oryzae]GMG52485.1 unnamed protein product [Aspergillus oryzae var. brunneus]
MATQSLSSLLQRTSIDDHEEVLRSSNAALAKSKSDIQAQHVKVVALLKLDRYEDALRVFEEGGDALKKRAALEYAYTLYKTANLDEAIEVVSQVANDRGARHLEAQAKFRRAADLYEELTKDEDALANEVNDLRINAWAVDAQLQWKGYPDYVRHNRPTRDDLEAFETVYNAACLSIAKGEFGQGEMLLKRAKGFISELSTKRVALNNITLVRDTTTNPYALYKSLHATPVSIDNDKLFDYQDNIVTGNVHAADLLVQKYDGIIRSTSKALSQAPYPSAKPNVNLLSVYNAAAHARGQAGTPALKAILPALERRPKDIGLALTAVQLYVTEGNTTSAITTLEKSLQLLEDSISEQDKEVRFNPGLLGILVSLYKLEGRRVQIRSELAKAAAYWQEHVEAPPSLLRAAAQSLLHSSDRADLTTAGDLFKSLYQKDRNDSFAIAGYVASQATLDYAKIESQVDTLPPIDDLISDVDVNALESAGISPPSSAAAAAAAAIAGARKRTSGDKQGRATKRVRKSRLPKDYDASKTPDPERWLPLRDRSNYRPKGRKGKQRAAERTQGGIVNEKAEESPAPVAQQQKSQGGGANKKKKKGKR